ncbi:hypothetical protein [Actinokineospora fastidiosa]|nr:hypothetical protein [Actinokineospora fastidiosa]
MLLSVAVLWDGGPGCRVLVTDRLRRRSAAMRRGLAVPLPFP